MGKVIGGDSDSRAANAKTSLSGDLPVTKKRGALVEDETLVGMEDGGVKPKAPDGKVEEGATDPRENRRGK